MCKAMEDLRNESYAEGREEGLLKEMGYVYGNRESTFGEGRLSLFFLLQCIRKKLPMAGPADKILFFVETVPANDLVGRVAAC